MADSAITKNNINALAKAVGIDPTDDEIIALAENLHATAKELNALDSLDLVNIEPAITFRTDSRGDYK